MTRPVLYGYWRSTAAYRVRIALALKGIEYASQSVHLVKDGGEQHRPEYTALNPAALVPALEIDGVVLSQSLAICEYLDETRPTPALLPSTPQGRALARTIAQDVACDMHPVNNLRVQQYLRSELGQGDQAVSEWMSHWMAAGFSAVEARLETSQAEAGFCLGNAPGLADLCVVAQAYNADRFGFKLQPYPRVNEVVNHCRGLPAFVQALPENQPDAPVAQNR